MDKSNDKDTQQDPQVTERRLNDDPLDGLAGDGGTLERLTRAAMLEAELGMYLQAGGEIH